MDYKDVLYKIDKLDTIQEMYECFDLLDIFVKNNFLNKLGQSDVLFMLESGEVRDCLYLIDHKWNIEVPFKDFLYDEEYVINFYYSNLLSVPIRGLSFYIAIYFKFKTLLDNRKHHIIDEYSDYEWDTLDQWFAESCQLNALYKFTKEKTEEICPKKQLCTENIDHSN